MGLLDGGLTGIFGAAFGSFFRPGLLYRATRVDSPGGDVSTTFALPQKCQVQTDSVTESMRGEAGYTEKDVRLIVLQAGLAEPDTDDEITVGGKRWRIASIDSDPALTHWIIRGTPK